MTKTPTYRVSELARLSGVSVRTLHHYDEIGLLVPIARSANGYRFYGRDSLLRLQQILIQRELGLALEEIGRALDDPNFDHETALIRQRELLVQRATTVTAMIGAIDTALGLLTDQKDHTMNMREIFDGFDPAKFEAETKERWGGTDAYKESSRRTKNYTAEDWRKLKDEQAAVYRDAAAAMTRGITADAAEVMDIAERHRLSIDRWFYPCSHAMHCNLADLYEADARFAANIDKVGAGLTPFLAGAIRANAQRNGR